MAKKMDDATLVAIIKANRKDSLGVEDGSLSNERADAMDHYHGRPYGNEEEGRSAVVSKDLAEAVDWAMPAIMDVFTRSGNLAEFEPIGEEDEEQAQQESDYANQVIMADNSGFMLLHDAIKDALLLKNGYVKHLWEETEKASEETYQGLTMEEVSLLFAEKERKGLIIEVVGQAEREIVLPAPEGDIPIPVFDIKIKVIKRSGRVRILAVPTEEVRVSKRCRGSLQDSPFTEHVTRKTRTDLLEMGMSFDFVDKLPAFNERVGSSTSQARDSVSEESENEGVAFADRSMDEIEYCEAYLRVDWDGDGKAELRKVVTCADQIPPGDEWNEPIEAVPLTGFVAKRVPHRHVGESLDDDLSDLQQIKTTLIRQMLDNVYRTNSAEIILNERANLPDFMQSLPGGVKRIKGIDAVQGAVMPVPVTPIVGQILPAIDYIDNTKEARTGINRATTGLDPDILKQSTKGAFLENLNRASQKIQLMIRMLAESGVKEMVQQVHGLLIRHQDKERVIKMRGKFVTVNPTEWEERTDLSLRVGLGTGTEEEKREKLMIVDALQTKLLNLGLVEAPHAYALFADIAETLGMQRPEKYASDPNSPEYQQMMQMKAQQPQPSNPLVEVEQIKQQAAMQREQMQLQAKAFLDAESRKQEQQSAWIKAQLDQQNADADRRSRELIEAAKLEVQALIANQKVDVGPPGIGAGLAESKEEAEPQQDEKLLAIMQGLQMIAEAMNRPKQVIRGEDGRVIGVQ